MLAFQCQPERTYIEDSDAKLSFTLDTLFFDTVFTTIGTVTRHFRIKNPNSQFIKIDRMSLAGGNNSVFRINVDDYIITSTALSNSPPFVPVVAAALRNKAVVVPGMIIGVIGYAIGNYLGVAIAYLLR